MSQESERSQVRTATTKTPLGPRSRRQAEERRLEIRRLSRLGLRQEEIARTVNVSPKTVSNDLVIIREEDRSWLFSLAKDFQTSYFRETYEFYRDRQRAMITIERDSSVSPYARVRACEVLLAAKGAEAEFLEHGPLYKSLSDKVQELFSQVEQIKKSQTATI
jgi:hypothetical protein